MKKAPHTCGAFFFPSRSATLVRSALIVHINPLIQVAVILGVVAAPAQAGKALQPGAEKLREYIHFDSSNREGTSQALGFLRDQLHREGISTQWIVSPEGLPNLYARLEAPNDVDQSIVLLHHADVVAAGKGWSYPPFGAEVSDGYIHGRGSLDAKSLGMAHLEAFLEANRLRQRLTRDLIFLAVADEEEGGGQGSKWLLEAHPELFDGVVAVLGEGGINRVYGDRIAWWGLEVAQKRPLWLQITAKGRPGHGSTLNLHTAPHRLVRALDRLLQRPLDFRATPEVRLYLQSIAPFESRGLQRLVANLDEILELRHPETKMLPGIPNFFLDSIQINMLQAGERPNSAPEIASAWIDIRLLPNTDGELFLEDVRERLGDDVEVKVILQSPQVDPSPTSGPGFDCVAAALAAEAPVVPAFIPGITDSRYFRQNNLPAYGFSPFRLSGATLKGIHGVDERIPIAEFERGVATMLAVVESCTTEPPE